MKEHEKWFEEVNRNPQLLDKLMEEGEMDALIFRGAVVVLIVALLAAFVV